MSVCTHFVFLFFCYFVSDRVCFYRRFTASFECQALAKPCLNGKASAAKVTHLHRRCRCRRHRRRRHCRLFIHYSVSYIWVRASILSFFMHNNFMKMWKVLDCLKESVGGQCFTQFLWVYVRVYLLWKSAKLLCVCNTLKCFMLRKIHFTSHYFFFYVNRWICYYFL